jgi:hypothetical protein
MAAELSCKTCGEFTHAQEHCKVYKTKPCDWGKDCKYGEAKCHFSHKTYRAWCPSCRHHHVVVTDAGCKECLCKGHVSDAKTPCPAKTCERCGSDAHLSVDCDVYCDWCGVGDHSTADCMWCVYCKDATHWTEDCDYATFCARKCCSEEKKHLPSQCQYCGCGDHLKGKCPHETTTWRGEAPPKFKD